MAQNATIAGIILCCLPQAATAGFFTGLGDFAGGRFNSSARAISADGSTVVGYGTIDGGERAFVWRSSTGLVAIGNGLGAAYGASADGSVVVGQFGNQAFRWTASGGISLLGDLPGGVVDSLANRVSNDGSVVIGYGTSSRGHEAMRWTESAGVVGLGDLPGGAFYSDAYGMSADGSVVVGHATAGNPIFPAGVVEAFRWTAAGMVGLGDLPGGGLDSLAYAASADGSVVVGHSQSDAGIEAFRWTAATGNDRPRGPVWSRILQRCVGGIGRRRRHCRVQRHGRLQRCFPLDGVNGHAKHP